MIDYSWNVLFLFCFIQFQTGEKSIHGDLELFDPFTAYEDGTFFGPSSSDDIDKLLELGQNELFGFHSSVFCPFTYLMNFNNFFRHLPECQPNDQLWMKLIAFQLAKMVVSV